VMLSRGIDDSSASAGVSRDLMIWERLGSLFQIQYEKCTGWILQYVGHLCGVRLWKFVSHCGGHCRWTYRAKRTAARRACLCYPSLSMGGFVAADMCDFWVVLHEASGSSSWALLRVQMRVIQLFAVFHKLVNPEAFLKLTAL
jgi:hypothetical protein